MLLLLMGAVTAVPLQSRGASECRKSCPSSDLAKFQYARGNTYRYHFESESSVKIQTIQGSESKLKWSAKVDLHFQSPCEVLLEIKNPQMEGSEIHELQEQLTKHPLRAVMSDGTIEEVCASKDDYTVSVNIKKGILSALQNTLPSNSTMHDGMQFAETDVLGVCPTLYKIRQESEKVIVEKSKDHRMCSKRYGHQRETAITAIPLKSPILMKTSKSECRQEIEDGIVKLITCSDHNEVSPMPGMQRHTVAKQESSLKLISVSKTQRVSSLQQIRKTDLSYDYTPAPKALSKIQEMEAKLEEFCASFKAMTGRTAQIYSDLLQLMHRVPETSIEEALRKIRAGQICRADKVNMESLYLDAVSATQNTGAIKVMVDEIIKGNRLMEYTWRLHSFPRVCQRGVHSVKTLFERDDVPTAVKMAAGSVVSRYCATEAKVLPGHCLQHDAVKAIMQTISQKLSQSCSKSKDGSKEKKLSLALLRSVGNIQRMDRQVQAAVLQCFKESSAANSVRVAAADALMSADCTEEVSEEMQRFVEDYSRDGELRISAYKAGIKCFDVSQIDSLLNSISMDHDMQVRSYVLSDLTNLQQSKAPHKSHIRERLATFKISQQYSQSPLNSSLSYDLSTYTQSRGFGFELDLDAIFKEAGQWPRQLRSNVTLALFKEVMNIGEMGVRMENMPAMLRRLVQPGTTLGETSIGKILQKHTLSQSDSSAKPEMEYFIKLFGKEVLHQTMYDPEDVENEALAQFYQQALYLYGKIINRQHLEKKKGFQSRNDIDIPTIQGIPLRITIDISVIASMNLKPVRDQNDYEIKPEVAAAINFFVGYHFGPSVGLKNNNTLFSSSDGKIQANLEYPKSLSLKMDFAKDEGELFTYENKAHMMIMVPGRTEQIKQVSQSRDPRLQSSKCTDSAAGVKICCEYDVVNPWQANDYPLVKMSHVKLIVKKENPSVMGYQLKVDKKINVDGYQMSFDILGTSNPQKFALDVEYENRAAEQSVTIKTDLMGRREGCKLVRKTSNSGAQKQCEVVVYAGEDAREKVFYWKSSVMEQKRLQLEAKTLGRLRPSVLADVEVDAELSNAEAESLKERLASLKIHKYRVNLGLREYELESFIQKRGAEQDSQTYVAQAELKRQRTSITLLKTVAKMTNVEKGFDWRNQVSMEYGGKTREVTVKTAMTPEKIYFSVQMSKEQSEKQLKLVMSCLYEPSTEALRRLLLSFELPAFDVSWKVKTDVQETGDQKAIDFSVESRGSRVLSVRGPVSASWSREEVKQKAQLGITFGESRETFHVATEVEMAEGKYNAMMVLNNEGKVLLDYLHSLTIDERQMSLVSKVDIPQIIKTDISYKDTECHIEADGEMKLEAYAPRHLQAQCNIEKSQPSEGMVSAAVYWDKSNDPGKKATLTGAYKLDEHNQVSLHGDVELQREKYQYTISTFFKSPSWKELEKHLKIEVMKESSDVFVLKSSQRYNIVPNTSIEIDSDFYLLTPHQNIYILQKQVTVIKSVAEVQVKQSMFYGTPLGELRMACDVSHKLTDQVFSVQGFLKTIAPNQSQPSLEVKYHGKAKKTPSDSISAELNFDVDAAGEKFSLQASEDGNSKELQVICKKNNNQLWQVKGKRSEEGRHLTIQLVTPSSLREFMARCDSAEKSFNYYPDSHNKQRKFSARYHDQSPSNQETRLGMVMEYPHNGQQKKISSSFVMSNENTNALVELDVFSRQDKILKVVLDGNKLDEGVYRSEVSIQTDKKKNGPKIILDTSMTPRDKYIVVTYKKDSSSAPSIVISTKYTKQSSSNSVVSFILKVAEKQIELGGTVTRENTYGCQGYKLNSTMQSLSKQLYDVEVLVCKPFFVKVITGAKADSERYVAKVGLESHTHAEISFMKNGQEESSSLWQRLSGSARVHQEIPITALSAKLSSPTTMVLRTQYNQDILAPTMSKLQREVESVSESANSLVSDMCRRVKTDVVDAFPELSEVMDEVTATIETIRNHPYLEELRQYYAESLREAKISFDRFFEAIKETFERIKQICKSVIDHIKNMYTQLVQMMHGFVQEIVISITKWFGSGDQIDGRLSEHISALLDKMERAISEKVTELSERLCHDSSERCISIKSTAQGIFEQLLKDLQDLGNFLLKDKSVQYARSVVRRYIDMVEKKQYSDLVQSAVMAVSKQNVGVLLKPTGLQVSLPLRQPVASVLAAPRYVGFPVISGLKPPNYRENQLDLPGYWIRIIDNELTTTENSKFTLPSLKCVYVLSKTENRSIVTMSELNGKLAFLTLSYKEASIKLEVNNKNIYLNDTIAKGDFAKFLLKGEFYVRKSLGVLVAHAAGIAWLSKEKERHNLFLAFEVASGIGWLTVPRNTSSSALLDMFKKFKLDPTCDE